MRYPRQSTYALCFLASLVACGDDDKNAADTRDTRDASDTADSADSADSADTGDAPETDDTTADSAADTADTTPDPAATLRIELPFDIDAIDPAISYFGFTWQYQYATCAMLLNYADDESGALVPEIASAMPEVSADGLTYTFRIRDGFRLSPPSGEIVTARTLKATFERAMDPEMHGAAPDFMSAVVGIEVAGADEDELVFTLAQPLGDFVARVALPFFCVVPSDTPHESASAPLPTAGPYYVASYTPVTFDEESEEVIAEGELVLLPNPNYQGTRPHALERIAYRLGSDDAAALARAKDGQTDYIPFLPQLRPEERAALVTAYGPASGDQRLFVDRGVGYRYLALNTSRETFADPDVRRAVQFAIDRAAIGAIVDLDPNDDYLPPDMPGYAGEHPYPLDGPDLDAARALMAGREMSAAMYIADREEAHAIAGVVQDNLAAVGISVTIEALPFEEFYPTIGDPAAPFDIALQGWFADYLDPGNFLNVLLGRSFGLANTQLDDDDFDAALEHAATLSGAERIAEYRRLDVVAMALSPMVVLGNPNEYNLFSTRIGCHIRHPLYGYNLAALCLQ